MTTFAKHFDLNKSQAELDFVNVQLDRDTPLFLDPFAISQRSDRWSLDCHAHLVAFFQRVVDRIKVHREDEARRLLGHLGEPNETRFGLSSGKPKGAGIGAYQADQLFTALRKSNAVKSGFINSLEECELMIEGIGWDKISDLTTNVLRGQLATYTLAQCDLHGIETRPVAIGPHFAADQYEWVNDYLNLPVVRGAPVLLVPKAVARAKSSYDHRYYYRHFALEYLQAEHLAAGSSLVRALKNGKRRVYKTDLEAYYPCTKEYLFEFSKRHPNVLAEYRETLARLEQKGPQSSVDNEDHPHIAGALRSALCAIQPGQKNADEYHSLMVGALEFIFFPELLNPRKEQPIHQGRKRLDVLMENGARGGIFSDLHMIRKLPCALVVFECKNYRTDVANPELDQLSSRFSVNRGTLGFMCCRNFENRTLFVERCRDTFKDGRGLVAPIDDATLDNFLALIADGKRSRLNRAFADLINEVWVS